MTSTISIDELPTAPTITNNGPICSGSDGEFTFSGAGDLEVTYTLNGGATTNLTLDGSGSGVLNLPNLTTASTLAVTLVSDGTCEDSPVGLTSTISIDELPTASILTSDTSYCDYEFVENVLVGVSGTPNFEVTYLLDGIAQTQVGLTSPISLGNEAGVYEVLTVSDNNCVSDLLDISVIITIKPSPSIPEVISDTVFCVQDNEKSITIIGEDSLIYEWYIKGGTTEYFQEGTTLIPLDDLGETIYELIAVEDGCESLSTEVSVIIKDCNLEWPSAFTPNNDGINDYWELPLLDLLYPNNNVKVFNRWGGIVYEHNSTENGLYSLNKWDGTFKGELLPMGSYLFIIELNDELDRSVSGAVSLLLD